MVKEDFWFARKCFKWAMIINTSVIIILFVTTTEVGILKIYLLSIHLVVFCLLLIALKYIDDIKKEVDYNQRRPVNKSA